MPAGPSSAKTTLVCTPSSSRSPRCLWGAPRGWPRLRSRPISPSSTHSSRATSRRCMATCGGWYRATMSLWSWRKRRSSARGATSRRCAPTSTQRVGSIVSLPIWRSAISVVVTRCPSPNLPVVPAVATGWRPRWPTMTCGVAVDTVPCPRVIAAPANLSSLCPLLGVLGPRQPYLAARKPEFLAEGKRRFHDRPSTHSAPRAATPRKLSAALAGASRPCYTLGECVQGGVPRGAPTHGYVAQRATSGSLRRRSCGPVD
jgi:hypothetical protein